MAASIKKNTANQNPIHFFGEDELDLIDTLVQDMSTEDKEQFISLIKRPVFCYPCYIMGQKMTGLLTPALDALRQIPPCSRFQTFSAATEFLWKENSGVTLINSFTTKQYVDQIYTALTRDKAEPAIFLDDIDVSGLLDDSTETPYCASKDPVSSKEPLPTASPQLTDSSSSKARQLNPIEETDPSSSKAQRLNSTEETVVLTYTQEEEQIAIQLIKEHGRLIYSVTPNPYFFDGHFECKTKWTLQIEEISVSYLEWQNEHKVVDRFRWKPSAPKAVRFICDNSMFSLTKPCRNG